MPKGEAGRSSCPPLDAPTRDRTDVSPGAAYRSASDVEYSNGATDASQVAGEDNRRDERQAPCLPLFIGIHQRAVRIETTDSTSKRCRDLTQKQICSMVEPSRFHSRPMNLVGFRLKWRIKKTSVKHVNRLANS